MDHKPQGVRTLYDFYFSVTFLEASKTRPAVALYQASSPINLTKKEKFVLPKPGVSMFQPTLPSPMPPWTAVLHTSQPTGNGSKTTRSTGA